MNESINSQKQTYRLMKNMVVMALQDVSTVQDSSLILLPVPSENKEK